MTREEAEKFVREFMVRTEPWKVPDEEIETIKWASELLLMYQAQSDESAK